MNGFTNRGLSARKYSANMMITKSGLPGTNCDKSRMLCGKFKLGMAKKGRIHYPLVIESFTL
jgi:hypothetical protein